ncbi:MAG: SCO family protein [Casimicrobiaceae bacterium]
MPDLKFTMTDDRGRVVGGQDYRGEMPLLFFGYSHCPDECSATLARLAQAVASMKASSADVRILVVTVDPQRDTESRLHSYLGSFGPEFVGLRGTPSELAALANRYRVTYSVRKLDAGGDYEVTHSDAVSVFDRTGRAPLLIRPEDPVSAIAADLERLSTGKR